MIYNFMLLVIMFIGCVIGVIITVSIINMDKKESEVNKNSKKEKNKKRNDKNNILKQRTTKEKSVVDIMCETYNLDERELLNEQRKLVDKDFEYLNTK